MLAGVSLAEHNDEGYWALNSNGKYTSKSLYEAVVDPGVKDLCMMDMWKSNMPLKIKKFVWMCLRGQIQVAKDLKSKGWPGEPGCKLCGKLESVNHLIFGCPLSHFCWWWLKSALGWPKPPSNFEDFLSMGLKQSGAKSNYLGWAIFGVLIWTIWLSRNDFVFNNNLSSSPTTNIYKFLSLMSQWTPLLPAKRKKDWLILLDQLKVSAKNMHFL